LTLKDWAENWPYRVTRLEHGAYVPDSGLCRDHRRNLWNLSDYGVLSVSAGMIYLWKKGSAS